MTTTAQALTASIALLIAACTSDAPEASGGATGSTSAFDFASVTCPTDVTSGIVTDLSCGFLSVPEDRADPDGDRIRLFVVRVSPPGGDPEPDPMLVVGTEFGAQPGYGNIAPLAQRVKREVIFLDHRGSAHSEPLLSCPEIEALHPGILAVPSTGDRARAMVIEAAAACADRLRAAGVDLDDFDLDAMAEDVEALRGALGIGEWNLYSIGATSLIALEVARRYPQGVRSVVLDGPSFPEVDPVEEAIAGMRALVAELDAACRQHGSCQEELGGFEEAVRRSFLDLGSEDVQVAGTTVRIDDAALARVYRDILPETEFLSIRPLQVASGNAARPGSSAQEEVNAAIAEVLLGGAALCRGNASECSDPWAHGAHLSVLCADRMPFVDPTSVDLAADEPWWGEAWGSSPLAVACEGWDVAASDPAIAEPFTGDIPVFVIVGRFDRDAAEIAARTVAAMPRGHLVVVPSVGWNPLGAGGDCPLEIRNAWVADPTAEPDTSCLDEIAAIDFETDVGAVG